MIIIQPTPFRKQMVGKLIEYEFLDERSNFKIWFGLWWSNPKVGSNRIKGELKRLSFNRQFSPKSLKVGQKSGQRVQNWPNKNQVASDLLRAFSNSVLRAAEGIHELCHPTYWGNPLVDNFSIRPAEGILQFCHRSYWGNLSILSSDLLRESTGVCFIQMAEFQVWDILAQLPRRSIEFLNWISILLRGNYARKSNHTNSPEASWYLQFDIETVDKRGVSTPRTSR